MSSHSAPTRTLPQQPNLDHLRKQAKELLKSYLAGQDVAVVEVERFERSPDQASFGLADAQRVLARAYGFSSWAKLKQHVEGVNAEIFCAAADAGDVATVRKLARQRPELVKAERGGEFGDWTALHFAVLNRDAKMTHALMELGSDARAGIWPHRDATAACTIAAEREYDEIVAIIEQAEERRRQQMSPSGATVGSKTDAILEAILHGRTEEAIQILESDLSLAAACNHDGMTPLHMAAWTHNPLIVAWLLDHEAPVDAQAPGDMPVSLGQTSQVQGRTPLDFAAMVAGWSTHRRIHPFMENAGKSSALFYETFRLLRSKGAVLTPRAAVAVGDKEAVLQFHRAGRLKNEIHMLRGGLVAIGVRVDRIDMVALLLDLGLDPDEPVTDENGSLQSWGMPLWFASLCGRYEIAELLLKRGADVNSIVYACGDPYSMAEDEKLEALLRHHGARLTVEQVTDLKTAQAILDGSVPAYSLNVDEPTRLDLAEQMLWAASGNPEFVRICLPYMKREPNDPWWNYVLLHAKQPEGFKLILDHGVNPDVLSSGGYTILHHLASDYSNGETRISRATILLDAGASLTKRDSLLKSTPLGWACRWGRIELVRLYLEHGAVPVESDAEPWSTPLAWATKHQHRTVVELLRSHGAR